jgi:hypothetical protein
VNSAVIKLILECVANAEDILRIAHPEGRGAPLQGLLGGPLPQMPQPTMSARRVITDQEYEFEERAAIIEYDGGLPRLLAEFLARRGREQ